MKIHLFFFVLLSFQLFSCGGSNGADSASTTSATQVSKDAILNRITELETRLLKIEDARKDTAAAREMIEQTDLFVTHFPSDSMATELQFRAGDVARGLGDYDKAISLWQAVLDRSREHPLAPRSLFAIAFTYDAEMRNATKAIRYYQHFLEKYPNHPLSTEAQQLLDVATESPEDLIKKFEKQRKK